MGYVLTEEQHFLKDSAKDLLKQAPVALVRELRDSEDQNGYSTDLWKSMVEMGWCGLSISEESGGLGFGIRGMGIILEEAGRSLSSSPLLTVAVSSFLIEKYGNATQKERLTQIAEAGSVVALAIQEGALYRPESAQVICTSSSDKLVLNGTKTMVSDAHMADSMIVSAQTNDGLSTFLINTDLAGVSMEPIQLMDTRYYSDVHFDHVEIDGTDLLGKSGKGATIINDLTSLSNALLSAELVGLMSEAFDRTIDYLKERRQFDKEIGSFQGLQHRAADLYGEIEVTKSIAYKAMMAIDSNDFMAPAFCSMAKARACKTSQLATNEGVQMFGGIGMTDDEEIGFFLKRARVASQLFGGHSYHVDRFAKMSGY